MYSGEYWIDPNDGDQRDAILVLCDADTRSTCIFSSPLRTPEISYLNSEPEVWLNEINSTLKVLRINK